MKGNAMSWMRDQSHDGLVHGKQGMEWDRLDKTSMVGAERPRKGEEGGSQRRER